MVDNQFYSVQIMNQKIVITQAKLSIIMVVLVVVAVTVKNVKWTKTWKLVWIIALPKTSSTIYSGYF